MEGLAGKKRENDIISKINKNKKKKACHRPSVWVLTELRFQKGPFLQRLWDGKRRPQLTNRTGNVPCQRHHQSAQRSWASLTDKSLASDCGSSCKVKGYQSTQSLPSLPLVFSWKPDLEKRKILQAKKYLWHTYIKTKRTVIPECFLRVPYRRKRKEPWPLCALNSFLHHPSGCEKGSPGSAGNLGHRTQALRTGMWQALNSDQNLVSCNDFISLLPRPHTHP